MKCFVLIPCAVLVVTAVAKAQHCWCPQSASPGAAAIVGQVEDQLVSGPPWEVGGTDVRSAWLTHGGAHPQNRVLAAVFDGSQANQTVVVEEGDFWADTVNGTFWRVNYDVRYLGVKASDLSNLSVSTQFLYNGIVRLTLNHIGSAASGQVRWVTAPQHSWFESPVETGGLWKIRVTLSRSLIGSGQPTMIWIDNYTVEEGTTTLFEEPFYTAGDTNFDNLVNGIDVASFVETILNPGAATPHEICAADLNDDMVADELDIPEFVDRLLSS